jgi:Bax protein
MTKRIYLVIGFSALIMLAGVLYANIFFKPLDSVAHISYDLYYQQSQFEDEFNETYADLSTPDFSTIKTVKQKKQAFINYLLPMVRLENDLTLIKRKAVKILHTKYQEKGIEAFSKSDIAYLESVCKTYKVKFLDEPINEEMFDKLLTKIDMIPASLVLAQAAKESGWGTSRFAKKANNYFGQWCYKKGCGLIPSKRGSDKQHEVAQFDNPRQSVASYMININAHKSYKPLRTIRKAHKEEGKKPSGIAMAEGLADYSENGSNYIKDIQLLISRNKLQDYNQG